MPRRVLWQTEVGFRMWSMDHPGPDTDIFEVYMESPRLILRGEAEMGSSSTHRSDTQNTDIATHEISHVVDQIVKGNVNFLFGVMSPLVISAEAAPDFPLRTFREIVAAHPSRNVYNSTNGLAVGNRNKYLVNLTDTEFLEPPIQKRAATIIRTCHYGATLLTHGRHAFLPVTRGSIVMADVDQAIEELNLAHANSTMPDHPPTEPFRNWLGKYRLAELYREIDAINAQPKGLFQ
jgi:hypothetical protein